MTSKVLLIGLGNLGGEILKVLALSGVTEIIAASRDEETGIRQINHALSGAAALGSYPKISFRTVDLNNIQDTSLLLEELEPDLIFNTADVYPFWRFYKDLPREIAVKLAEGSKVGFCAALPFRLSLPYKLMTAVKKSGIKTHVLITNDPCEVINPLLGKVGLAPTAGIGDFAHLVEPIKIVVGSRFKVPIRDVQVYFIADFSTFHLFRRGKIPEESTYYLKVMMYDREITKSWKPLDILLQAGSIRSPRARGADSSISDQFYTASLAIGDILAILNDTGEIRHCPGPSGLVGGYPVKLNSKGAEVILPEEITLEAAVMMNEEAQKLEGIEKIREDGTIVFTQEATRIMDELLGINLPHFNVKDYAIVAEELDLAYKELVNRYKARTPGQ